jgi:hypothetical protein
MLEIPLYLAIYIYILIIDVACWQDGVKAEYVCLSTNHGLAFDGLPISFAFDDPISFFLRPHVN